MSILEKLSTSLNRNDEAPNKQLAIAITSSQNKNAVKELFANLANKDKGIQNDCIKVIYEIGAIKPSLISAYVNELISLLKSKNNRMQWGAMTALNSLTNEIPARIYSSLPEILDRANKGSVITNDHCMGILSKLCAIPQYSDGAFVLLNERMKTALPNQLPMYAENALPVIQEKNKSTFIKTLTGRLTDIEKESGRGRVQRVIQRLSK